MYKGNSDEVALTLFIPLVYHDESWKLAGLRLSLPLT